MKSISKIGHRNYLVTAGFCLFIAACLISGKMMFPAPAQPQNFGASTNTGSWLTHIAMDKPIYRSGERLYVRAVMLQAIGHRPGALGTATFEIKGPKGDTIASGPAVVTDSIAGYSWDIPADQAGGEYSVRVTRPMGGDPPAERKFEIRSYRAPRLKSQIVFVRDGYGPGDTVGAGLHVSRAEGGIPTGAKVSVIARVDEEEVWRGETVVDGAGNASVSFKLPSTIARGNGAIAMIIQDGGTVETATKTIPILLQTMDVSLYPEGGDLIAGLTNRVYVEGRTPAKKPADMAGSITDAAGQEIATFRTEHEGRGRFTFVPRKGESYFLHLTEPAGIKAKFPLPEVKESGIVITSTSDVTPRQKDIVVRLATTKTGTYGIGLAQRSRELAFKSVVLEANESAEVAFTVPRALDGVVVVTAYDDQKITLAERLLFRQPEHSLNVRVTADRADYVPGDKVNLRIATTDDTGNPVGAVVGLTVTDSSVLEMIDKREQTARLPVMVLLESEVRDLSDAHVYLDETNPKGPLATDLLLGTQGWRRFATVNPKAFTAMHGDAARRVLAVQSPNVTFLTVPGNFAAAITPAVRLGEWPNGGPNSGMSGFVMDRTRALIPGTTVTAIAVDTGIATTILTDDAGAFNFISLQPGTYKLSASLTGFQTRTLTGIALRSGVTSRYALELSLASAATTVDVSVSADAILATSSASIGQVVDDKRIRDLPLVGNNVLDLKSITPGHAQPINPDLVGEIHLILQPVDAELGRGNSRVVRTTRDGMNTGVVREYAHSLPANAKDGSRSDFAETVYWNTGIKTDASTGVANVSFNLSDAVTAFRVLADGFTTDGTLGSAISEVESVRPMFIEPKFPLQVTSGDVIQLPIGFVNGTRRELRDANITARATDGLKLTTTGEKSAVLGPKERARRLMQIEVGREFKGLADLTLDAAAGPYRDTVKRTLDVQAPGFPFELSAGGVLEANGSRSFEFTLPAETVHASLSSSVRIYPTPLASMTGALQALLQQPNGCFEQTSSTSYPIVMAQQYFLTHSGVEPGIIARSRDLLETSYKRLTGFESRTKGYEWFGGSPGHEALTAYGLMQFTDMAQVRKVDPVMLERTRSWLLDRRDGSGGFDRDVRSHGAGIGSASTITTNAYITWALVESGQRGLEKEIAAVRASAESTNDSYIVTLVANILHATGDHEGARRFMDKLVRNQEASGRVNGATSGITQSGGESLAIETTALAVLGWIHDPLYVSNVEKGIKWIIESSRNGRFGSTQSTVLALRAIVAYDASHARPKAAGRVLLTVDGKMVGAPVDFTVNSQDAIVLPEFASELKPGKHTMVVKMEKGSGMPFSMSVKYNSTLPDSAEKSQIGIRVLIKDANIPEGAVTEAVVSISNKTDEAIPTPVAIVGIPGGLEVRNDQLRELVKSGRVDAYEVRGREVILYWRFLPPKDNFEIPLSLVASIPGTYTGPASRAYLYYTDEYKTWAPGLKVNIMAR
jgi:hypothetical protein